MSKAASNRVLYVMNDWCGGGAQTGLLTLLEAGLFEGQELHVLSLMRGDGQIAQPLARLLPQGQIHLLSEASRMGLRHMLLGLFAYPYWLCRLKPHTVILSLPQANIIGRFWGHLFRRPQLVAFEHNTHYAKGVYGLLLKLLARPVDALMADTDETARQVLAGSYRGSKKRARIILPLFSGKAVKNHIKTDYKHGPTTRLLVAGRLSAAKNHTAILKAMALLRDKGHPTELHICGTGNLQSNIKKEAQLLGLEEKITFHGYLTPWTQRCPHADVYLQPSWHEGLCITVLEAMTHGMPVVASRVGGLRDYGRDGKNLLFIKPEDPETIAAAILKLRRSPALSRQVGTTARTDIHGMFGTKALQARIETARKTLGWKP